MSTKQPPLYRLVLLLLLLAAFALRVYHLAYQSLWYDEGVTAWVAQAADVGADDAVNRTRENR